MSAAELRQAAHILRDGGVNRCTAEVGSALADWLMETAEQFELIESQDWDRHHRWADRPIAVARAINGGVS